MHPRTVAALTAVSISLLGGCHPDLVITHAVTRWDDHQKYVGVNVANQGPASAPNVRVRFQCDRDGEPVVIEQGRDTSWWYIEPHGSASFGVDFEQLATPANNCLEDVKTITVIVDPGGKINESNEQNNILITPIRPEPEYPDPRVAAPALSVQFPPKTAVQGRPISLRFNIEFTPDPRRRTLLTALTYELRHGAQTQPFFSDEIQLYGFSTPGTLDVTPGVQFPTDHEAISVIARLHWGEAGAGVAAASASTRAELSHGHQEARMYELKREGFLRRHIVDSGRELSSVWLKEYQPGHDRKELLHHSRTFTVEGRTRVYVPWTGECRGSECGDTVLEGSAVLYGGDENPLLLGGLAMSVFANEYLATGDERSLRRALRLFEYIERSEWKEPATGAPSGFFLRSDWPGKLDRESKRQYLNVSVDELAGMALGLGRLNAALLKAGASRGAMRSRLVGLADRMGTQLRDNYYVIAPLKKVNGNWVDIGLPVELHRGWPGALPYQWFFAKGLRAITGKDYEASTSGMTKFAGRLVGTELPGAQRFALDTLVDLAKPTPHQLAIASIQGLGVAMYYQSAGEKWQIPIPCWKDSKKVDFADFKRFNFPMLLHVFQFGMLDESGPSGERDAIKKEMARLLRGVLSEGGETTKLDMSVLLHIEWLLLGPAALIPTVFCNHSPEERVGTVDADHDAYAAAVALTHGLIDQYDDPSSRGEFAGAIEAALRHTVSEFTLDLPVAETGAQLCLDESGRVAREPTSGLALPCDSDDQCGAGRSCRPIAEIVKVPKHNPGALRGGSFTWESRPDDRVMGNAGHMRGGLSAARIFAAYESQPSVDSMVEGAGFDYLLPMSMLLSRRMPRFRPYESSTLPELPVCASDPVTAASPPGTPYHRPCALRFPSLPADMMDAPSRNDSLARARVIDVWGKELRLSLDRETSWGTSLGAPHQDRYPPQAVWVDGLGAKREIPLEADHDYFVFQSPRGARLVVTPPAMKPAELVVNGARVEGLSEELSGGYVRNVFRVTGGAAEYGLRLSPRWTSVSGRVSSAAGVLEVELARAVLGYQGRLVYRAESLVLEAAHVTAIHGTARTIVFEGMGRYRGTPDRPFRVTVLERCPQALTIEVGRPDGTMETIVSQATASQVALTFQP